MDHLLDNLDTHSLSHFSSLDNTILQNLLADTRACVAQHLGGCDGHDDIEKKVLDDSYHASAEFYTHAITKTCNLNVGKR